MELSTNVASPLLELAKPLIKYLAENHHPHITVIVTSNSVEMMEGIEGHTLNDFLVH